MTTRIRLPSIPEVEAAISRAQCRENVVRMPVEIRDPRCFDLAADIIPDLRDTQFLASLAVPGLMRLARGGRVRLRLSAGSQPFTKLKVLFTNQLRPSLGHPDEWELVCPQ